MGPRETAGNLRPYSGSPILWTWPKRVDRDAIEDLFTFKFVEEGINAVLLGPNGVGKTMFLRNLAHQGTLRGHTVCFNTASEMLSDLAAQESSVALARRLRRYVQPRLLCIDEVGYVGALLAPHHVARAERARRCLSDPCRH